MPKIFDATVKELGGASPPEFLAVLKTHPTAPVRVLNVDLSTITTSADLVFGIGDPLQEVVHVDSQTGPDGELHRNVLVYNALLYRIYRVPVRSIVLLLRSKAQHSNVNGSVHYEGVSGPGSTDFRYVIIRLWEQPVEELLAGSLAMLPFAPLCRLPENLPLVEGLGSVIRRVVERLDREAGEEQGRKLWTATFILTGLRVLPEQAHEIFKGVSHMHDSSTYQMILDEGMVKGRVSEVKNTLLRLGPKRFGPADAAVVDAVKAIEDPERLERMRDQLLDVSSWEQLLAIP
jgi:hypothetical protein